MNYCPPRLKRARLMLIAISRLAQAQRSEGHTGFASTAAIRSELGYPKCFPICGRPPGQRKEIRKLDVSGGAPDDSIKWHVREDFV